jgi:hypothetical protein
MKFSVEKDISRNPVGTETGRIARVDGIDFLYYYLGSDHYVWRTADQYTVEIAQRGGGGTFYCKVKGVILERAFDSLQSAAKAGALFVEAYAAPVAIAYK